MKKIIAASLIALGLMTSAASAADAYSIDHGNYPQWASQAFGKSNG